MILMYILITLYISFGTFYLYFLVRSRLAQLDVSISFIQSKKKKKIIINYNNPLNFYNSESIMNMDNKENIISNVI